MGIRMTTAKSRTASTADGLVTESTISPLEGMVHVSYMYCASSKKSCLHRPSCKRSYGEEHTKKREGSLHYHLFAGLDSVRGKLYARTVVATV